MLPEFLNVDLEIESSEPLDPIASEFGDKVHILYNDHYKDGVNLLAVEIHSGDDPDTIIGAFCDLVDRLPAKTKTVWRKASARRFDIGIASGKTDKKRFKLLRLDLNPETLKRVSALSAQIAITVYPVTSAAKSKKKVRVK